MSMLFLLGDLQFFDIPYVYGLAIFSGTVLLLIPVLGIELGRICCPQKLKDGMPTKLVSVPIPYGCHGDSLSFHPPDKCICVCISGKYSCYIW